MRKEGRNRERRRERGGGGGLGEEGKKEVSGKKEGWREGGKGNE